MFRSARVVAGNTGTITTTKKFVYTFLILVTYLILKTHIRIERIYFENTINSPLNMLYMYCLCDLNKKYIKE